MRYGRGAAIGVVAALAALAAVGPLRPAAAANERRITLSADIVGIGDSLRVTLTDWEAGAVTISICGNEARRGSVDCALRESQGVGPFRFGLPESALLAVVEPPAPCPCVVRVSTPGNDAVKTAPIELRGVRVGPVVGAQPPGPVLRVTASVSAPKGAGLQRLRSAVGGRTPRRLQLTIFNTGSTPATRLDLSAAVGRDAQGGEPLRIPTIESLGGGQSTTVEIPFTLAAPAFGDYVVFGTVYGPGSPVGFTARTAKSPAVLLMVLAVLGLDAALVGVRRVQRHKAAGVARRTPTPLVLRRVPAAFPMPSPAPGLTAAAAAVGAHHYAPPRPPGPRRRPPPRAGRRPVWDLRRPAGPRPSRPRSAPTTPVAHRPPATKPARPPSRAPAHTASGRLFRSRRAAMACATTAAALLLTVTVAARSPSTASAPAGDGAVGSSSPRPGTPRAGQDGSSSPSTSTASPAPGAQAGGATTSVAPAPGSAATAAAASVGSPTAAIPASITVTPTTGLRDGQEVKLRASASGGAEIFGFEVFQCAAGATFEQDADIRPTQTGKCLSKPLSPTSDKYKEARAAPPSKDVEAVFRVGVGTDVFRTGDGKNISITCGKGRPCQLVLKVQYRDGFGFRAYPIEFA